jgi:hypothetical protein
MKGSQIDFDIYKADDIDKSSGFLEDGGTQLSVANYLSGISDFDELLQGVKYANTKLLHCLTFKENNLIFSLFYEKEQLNIAFDTSKIKLIEASHDNKIEVRHVSGTSRFLGALSKGAGGAAGAIGVLVGAAVGQLGLNISAWSKNVKSEMVLGSVYKLSIIDDENEENHIEITCRDANKYEMNRLFDKHLGSNLAKDDPEIDSSSCYIATICYESKFAPEVIEFKKFRDNVLSKNSLGRKFIKTYYSYTGPVSAFLKNKYLLNKLIRILFLDLIYLVIKKPKT